MSTSDRQTGLQLGHTGPSFEAALVYEEVDDTQGEGERAIGWVAVHADGRLEVTEVEADRERFLQQVVRRMNGKAQISLISQAPPARSMGQPFATCTVTVSRGDPYFPEALRSYLQLYYGLRLT